MKVFAHYDGSAITEGDWEKVRLIQAFRLDPQAVLKACSWGKFQIMGDSYSLCAVPDIEGKA